MGLFSKVFGGSKSSSTSNPSTVWEAQTPYLTGLYQRAQNASLGMGSGGWGQAQQQMGLWSPPGGNWGAPPGSNLLDQPQGQQQNLRRQPSGGLTGWQRTLAERQQRNQQPVQPTGQAGYDPLSGLGQSLTGQGMGMLGQLGMLGQIGNPFAQMQMQQLGAGLGDLYQNYVAPTINSQFAGGGTLGGSRHALGLGQAAGELGRQYNMGAANILGNSAQLALGANQAGIGGLGSVFGAGNAAVFGSLPGLAGLIGGPTVLGGGGSSSSSSTNGILASLTGGITNKSGTMGIGF